MANVLRTAGISSKACHNQALDISETGVVSVCTSDGVDIFDFSEQPFHQVEPLSYRHHRIRCLDKPHSINVQIKKNTAVGFRDHVTNGDLMEILLDHDLGEFSKPQAQNAILGCYHSGYRLAKWSPPGLDSVGRSVLATVTRDYRFSLYSLGQSVYNWNEEQRLCSALADIFVRKGFTMEGTVTEPEELLEKYKHRLACVTTTELCWCPHLFERKHQDVKPKVKRAKVLPPGDPEKCKFARMATAMRSGHIIIWKIDVPLRKRGYHIEKILYLGQGCYVSSILWCSQEAGELGHLVVGCDDGQVMTVDLSDFTVTEIWEDKDRLSVTNLIYHKQKHVLLASKGVYIINFHLHPPDKFTVMKMTTQSINNTYPITAMATSSDQIIFIGTADENVVFDSAPYAKGLELNLQPLLSRGRSATASVRNHGVALSENNCLLYLLESPSGAFCHLSLKSPLKLHIIAISSAEDIYKKILSLSEGLLSSISDYLVCLKHYLSQEDWPTQVQNFFNVLSDQTLLSKQTTFQLKLLRCLVQLKVLQEEKSASDTEKESSKSMLTLLEQHIYSRHLHAVIQSGADHLHNGKLSETEKKCLYLMRHFMESQCLKHLDTQAAAEAENALKKISTFSNETNDIQEFCKICKKELPATSMHQSTCEKGHTFGRCGQTLLTCQVVPYRKCSWCDVVALCKLSEEESMPWFSEIQTDVCSLCDHTLLHNW